MAIIAATLARIKSDPINCIGGKQRVNEHFAEAGHVWRERLLDPATTLMLFILQVLHGNTAITHLRHLAHISVAAASYCTARRRLPLEALAQLVENVSRNAMESIRSRREDEAKFSRDSTSWLGRRVSCVTAHPSQHQTRPLCSSVGRSHRHRSQDADFR